MLIGIFIMLVVLGCIYKIGACKMLGLRCPHINCNRCFKPAFTQRKEIEKVQAHFWRCHSECVTPEEVVDILVVAEELTKEKDRQLQ